MRVVILPDVDFLTREQAMLGRLEIGLADEGVRVVHAIPASAEAPEAAGVYSTTVTYLDKGVPFSAPLRISALVRTLSQAIDDRSPRGLPVVDAVYAPGERAWPFAVELGRRLNAGVLLDVWKAALAPAARQLASRVCTRSVVRGLSLRFLAPDNPSAALLRRDIPSALAPVVPWGVHPGEIERAGTVASGGAGETFTVVLLATGADGLAVRAALEGLSRVASQHPGLLVLVDAGATERLPIWAWAKAHGLTDRLSVISDLEGRRDLVLHADMLIVTEASGEHRSLVLDAFASRMLVVAVRDPMVEWLSDDRYAALLDQAGPGALARVVHDLIIDPARASLLRDRAFDEIVERRSGSAQVRALLGVIEALSPPADSGTALSGGGMG
ncbi:MAG: hypothetical protein ACT4PL_10125 [Phycisphaerales bacterium]